MGFWCCVLEGKHRLTSTMKSNELEEEAENGDVNQQQNDNSEKQVTFVDFIPTRTLFGRVDRHR